MLIIDPSGGTFVDVSLLTLIENGVLGVKATLALRERRPFLFHARLPRGSMRRHCRGCREPVPNVLLQFGPKIDKS